MVIGQVQRSAVIKLCCPTGSTAVSWDAVATSKDEHDTVAHRPSPVAGDAGRNSNRTVWSCER